MRLTPRILSIAVMSALVIPGANATNGYMSHAYSPAAKGMAGAGEAALPQDSMCVVGNPACLTKIGQRADAGAAWFSPRREYTGSDLTDPAAIAPIGSDLTGGKVESRHDNFLIPNFGYSHPIDDVSAVGVALFGNGGMNSQYASRDTFNGFGTYGGNIPVEFGGTNFYNLGGGNTGINYEQLGLSLTYSRDVMDGLSLGISGILAMQKIEVKGLGAFTPFTKTFTEAVVADPFGPGAVPNSLTDNGDDYSYGGGFSVGALWDINPMFSVGAMYRSKMWMGEFDDYEDTFAEGGDLDIPAVGAIGVAFKPNDQLSFAFDIQHIWYSDVDAINNDNKLPARCDVGAVFGQPNFGGTYDPSYCLGGNNGPGFGWDDMTVFKIGVQYELNPEWTLRAGYSHADQPISGSQVAFNVLAPAVIEDHWTLGLTYALQDTYELTFWGMYAPEETVSGPGVFTGSSSPKIRMHQYEVGVNFGWLF